jgi:hypothetical protein
VDTGETTAAVRRNETVVLATTELQAFERAKAVLQRQCGNKPPTALTKLLRCRSSSGPSSKKQESDGSIGDGSNGSGNPSKQ